MIRIIIVILAVASFGGCAHFKREPSAPTCDGKHRRPANTHGSVLSSPGTQASDGPAAALSDPSFARCGS